MNIISFLQKIKKYIIPYKWIAIFIICGRIIEAGIETAIATSFKFIIDEAIVPKNYHLLILILSLLGVGAVLLIIVTLLVDYFDARFSIVVINEVRRDMFKHIQNLSMEFFGRRSAGDIVNCFLADAEKVESSIIVGMRVVFFNISNILFTAVYLFFLNWRLAILSSIALAISAFAPTLILRLATQEGFQLRQKEGYIASVIEENILSQSAVKIFGLENRMANDFSIQLDELKQVYVKAKFLNYLVQRIPLLSFIVVQLLILGISAAMTYSNLISVGTLVSFQILLIGLNVTIDNLSWGLPYLVNGTAGMQRISNILEEVPKIEDAADAVELPHFSQYIRFENVAFSYSEERGGIKDLSLTIRQGEFAVFVGSSGAGKSTIINLLTRFYDPKEGCILLDGVDLRHATVRSLRSQMGLVSQEVILFNGTIRENIRLGCLEATDEQIEAAAKAAEIHDFILTLPQGYDTSVGDRGGQLSGGQRQRMALARALVRDPAILILDEATSALDPATEAGIFTTLEHIAKERTVIVVTHRLTQALRADVIFVLENGQIVAEGHHTDLIQEGGLYATLWQQSNGVKKDLPELLINTELKVSDRYELLASYDPSSEG